MIHTRMSTARISSERGAAAVEFAIIAMVLFTVVFGIIAFGLFFSRYQVYQAAAREGARVAAVRTEPGLVQDRVLSAAQPYAGDLTGPISVSVAGGGAQCTLDTRGSEITVSWPQSFDISLPFVPAINFIQTISGVFRCE